MSRKALLLAVGVALAAASVHAADAVNINSAESGAIAQALGVADYIGARIVAEREENGPYKGADDLKKRVHGLDAKAVDKNKDKLRL